jgi:hypothetical protein
MPQAGKTRRFLYVEVPLPTKRALSVRSAASDIINNTSQPLEHLHEVAASEKGSFPPLAVPSLKGKERQLEDEPLPAGVLRSGSPQQLAQAASESAPPAVELTTLFDNDNAHAGPSKQPLPQTNSSTSTSLQAPAMLHIASSSSSNLTPVAPQSEEEITLPKQKTSAGRRRRKKRVIAESDASDQYTRSSTSIQAAVSKKQSGISEGIPASSPTQAIDTTDDSSPEYSSLGVDEEITKILGRKRYKQEYAYTVKLKGGQRALVSDFHLASLLQSKQSLTKWQTGP